MEQQKKYNKLFVGGDLSGIQKFLYNISSKKAAVSLKGRSFYLSQYMKTVSIALEKAALQTGATSVKTIYCSGGKCYLITDHSDAIKAAIDICAQDLKATLWKKHMGQLGLNISYLAFSENANGTVNANNKEDEKPGYLWQVVNADFARQKNQKFKDILQKSYTDFFHPIEVGGNVKVCAITGVESPDCVIYKDENGKEEMYLLPSVYEQIKLGESLRNTQHFKTFEEYAGDTDLGILRMDVDGLGKRFITGFTSIAEYEAFSKRLVQFFEKEVENIQKEDTFRNYLNIIYAGGDDLFIVGRWDKVIDFAERIQKETEKSFKSDGISISGGIAIVNPKFPIAKAAELAGEAEDAAKSFKHPASGKEKNAFHLLGKTVSWDKEFAYVKSYQQQFVRLINQYSLSKSILHKIMLYASIADMNKVRKKQGKPEDFSYIWHISYYLTRYIKRDENNQAVKDFCLELKNKRLAINEGRDLELIALAARWAELLLKDDLV